MFLNVRMTFIYLVWFETTITGVEIMMTENQATVVYISGSAA